MIKLHIGCADIKKDGYINIDIRKTKATDVVTKAWELSVYKDSYVSEIYSRHMLEHLDPNDAIKALKEWYRVLKPSGKINVIVPCLEFHCKQLLEGKHIKKELNHALAGFYGWKVESRGGSRHDCHRWGYIYETLKYELEDVGFKDVCRILEGDSSEPRHLNLVAIK